MNEQLPAIRQPRALLVAQDPVAVFDTAAWEQMQRIATAMAMAPVTPDTLRGEWVGHGQGKSYKAFPDIVAAANCLQVVEQASRWGMSPFAVAQCASIVRGRLMYEGKLVAAVIDALVGVKLTYTFGKWNPDKLLVDVDEEPANDTLGVRVHDRPLDEAGVRIVDGYVAQWRTKGDNSPWASPADWRRQLRYRGAREWARAYEPAAMLGIVTDDEIDTMVEQRVAVRSAGEPLTIGHGFAEPKPAKGTATGVDGVAGVQAPPGTAYVLRLDHPRPADGKVPVYKDGVAFQWASVKVANKMPVYDLHAPEVAQEEPDEPQQTSDEAQEDKQSPGEQTTTTAEIREGPALPGTQTQTQLSPPTSDASPASTDGFCFAPQCAAMQDAKTWEDILGCLAQARRAEAWGKSSAEDHRELRKAAFVAASAIGLTGPDRDGTGDEARDAVLYRLWMEFGAADLATLEASWRAYFKGSYGTLTAVERAASARIFNERKTELSK